MTALGGGSAGALLPVLIGDQVLPQHRARAFAQLSFVLSFGTLLGELGAPLLRDALNTLVAPFTLCAVALGAAIVAFLSGVPIYRHGRTLAPAARDTSAAAGNIQRPSERQHLLHDPAGDWSTMRGCGATIARDFQDIRPILPLWATLPAFWALFESQNNLWIFQAQHS